MLAGAPGDHLRLFNFHLFGFEAGARVGAIAKRLAFRTPAGAPPIGARLDFLHDGLSLINDGFCHKRVGFRKWWRNQGMKVNQLQTAPQYFDLSRG
jgi:hypothetical protein